jgi:hypothetical protein
MCPGATTTAARNPASCPYYCSSSNAAKATATVVANREKARQQCKLSQVCPAAAPATAPAAAPATASSCCCPSLLLDMLAERVATTASRPTHITNSTITATNATSSDQSTFSSQHHRDWQCPARAAHTKAVLQPARERGITTGQ